MFNILELFSELTLQRIVVNCKPAIFFSVQYVVLKFARETKFVVF